MRLYKHQAQLPVLMYNLQTPLWSGCGKYQACAMRDLMLIPKYALHDTSILCMYVHHLPYVLMSVVF